MSMGVGILRTRQKLDCTDMMSELVSTLVCNHKYVIIQTPNELPMTTSPRLLHNTTSSTAVISTLMGAANAPVGGPDSAHVICVSI
jgi:hypothetical protein